MRAGCQRAFERTLCSPAMSQIAEQSARTHSTTRAPRTGLRSTIAYFDQLLTQRKLGRNLAVAKNFTASAIDADTI